MCAQRMADQMNFVLIDCESSFKERDELGQLLAQYFGECSRCRIVSAGSEFRPINNENIHLSTVLSEDHVFDLLFGKVKQQIRLVEYIWIMNAISAGYTYIQPDVYAKLILPSVYYEHILVFRFIDKLDLKELVLMPDRNMLVCIVKVD